ncbi:hypothetical protein BFV94_1601 [Alteromonas macleodii]|uniref:Uncharacterized protein n=1 Tax=Alteromonas macleodii TaxID=28108 RepID=A0AB36FVL0_ALTMA|nr:hypothetical protein BFV95_1600 [Alteromonas macleodii]OES35731.1 hypothetical protein BFV94_1601 [Alteromonas macleodii]OES36832.1 hypothetical protein BFV93_1597 [Alteromonas macleodii]OES42261.1 hypothetical protein BFV96_1600 [Alteromonas macleodii]
MNFVFVIKLQYPYNTLSLEHLSVRREKFQREYNQHVVIIHLKPIKMGIVFA